VPRLARARWPVLARVDGGGDDEVLWLVGVRRAAAAPITAATRVMLRVHAVPAPGPSSAAPLAP
jgi:hypothetical protein